jgi:hypothetical protein
VSSGATPCRAASSIRTIPSFQRERCPVTTSPHFPRHRWRRAGPAATGGRPRGGIVGALRRRPADAGGPRRDRARGRRPGGSRIQTLRDGFSEASTPMRRRLRHGGHTLTVGYANQFGLELLPVPLTPGVEVDYLNGTRLLNAGGGIRPGRWRSCPANRERPSSRLMEQYLTPVFQAVMGFDPRDPAWPQPAIAQYDAVTFCRTGSPRRAPPRGWCRCCAWAFADFWGERGLGDNPRCSSCGTHAFMAALATAPGTAPQAHPASRRFRHYAAEARLNDPHSRSPLTPLGVYRIRHGNRPVKPAPSPGSWGPGSGSECRVVADPAERSRRRDRLRQTGAEPSGPIR